MRRFIALVVAGVGACWLGCAHAQQPAIPAVKVVLLVAEQNIEGPQKAWWASEVDLSTVEAAIATKLSERGFQVLDPAMLSGVVKAQPAFRVIGLSDDTSLRLGRASKADYVVIGKAVASTGGTVPQSTTMRSCFANVTVKVINVKTGKVAAYLDAAGSSVHPDVITGGREALKYAGEDAGAKIIAALDKQQGGQ